MKRTTIFLDEAVERELQGLARREARPVASLVREALAEYLAGRRHPHGARLSFIGAGASGHSDLAERHEELLWRDRDAHGGVRRAIRKTRRKPTRAR
jgi:hypothetical protein